MIEPVNNEKLNSGELNNIKLNDTKKKDTSLLHRELVIIGAGPGGYVAAIYAAKKGLKVTLIEKGELGGTCLNIGCIPTKALVKSAEICNNIKNASQFGIYTQGELRVDMEKVIAEKDEVTKRLVSGIGFLMKKNKIELIKGQASFLSKDEILVEGEDNHRVKFDNLIVATGSKISKLKVTGVDLPFVMNSTQALSSTDLPGSITIVGGGVIGMEFAFIYRNLGVEVHVVEFLDRILTMVDRDVSREINKAAKKAGITIYTGARVKEISQSGHNQALVTYEDKKGSQDIISDRVLIATGREPNLDGLNIGAAGIGLKDGGRGVSVDQYMRTNISHIYAIGDVTDILQLAHVASHQGIRAVDNILGNHKEMDYLAVPNVIFTDPEIATVGLSEDDCKEKGLDYKVSKIPFLSNGKALTMKRPEGFIKLIKDNTNQKIIGGSIIGADASSLISSLTIAVSKGLTDEDIRDIIFAHPTTSEVVHEAAFALGIGALHL